MQKYLALAGFLIIYTNCLFAQLDKQLSNLSKSLNQLTKSFQETPPAVPSGNGDGPPPPPIGNGAPPPPGGNGTPPPPSGMGTKPTGPWLLKDQALEKIQTAIAAKELSEPLTAQQIIRYLNNKNFKISTSTAQEVIEALATAAPVRTDQPKTPAGLTEEQQRAVNILQQQAETALEALRQAKNDPQLKSEVEAPLKAATYLRRNGLWPKYSDYKTLFPAQEKFIMGLKRSIPNPVLSGMENTFQGEIGKIVRGV